MEVKLNTDSFEKEVLEADIPVLIDFWATWCMPCHMIAPALEEIAKDYEGKIKVGKVNVDEAGEIAQRYSVMSIPTLMVFDKGKVMSKIVGALPKEEIIKFIQPYIF